MTDYWLSKLFFDLQSPQAAADFRADPKSVLDRYRLKPDVRAAVLANDVAFLALRVNPYLLRYYFQYIGMKDPDFIAGLQKNRKPVPAHG